MFLNKFHKNFSTCKYQTSFLRFLFSDNPYLLRKPSEFDYYYFQIPFNFYIKSKDKGETGTEIFSLHSNWKKFQDWNKMSHLPQEILSANINQFVPQIKTLLSDFTLNNQNIKLVKDSFSVINDVPIILENDTFPVYLFPVQIKSNQYQSNIDKKEKEDEIRLVLKMTSPKKLSGVWTKII